MLSAIMPAGWEPTSFTGGVMRVRELLVEQLLEHNRLVVLRVTCPVHQYHVATPRCIEQWCQGILMSCELLSVEPPAGTRSIAGSCPNQVLSSGLGASQPGT